ncbi:MAG: GNAT family N-acetyltransferase [Lentisphaeria bacterium]|nr:GNAT family N-acetyltransferase [Lentisphaeria bacterium]
MYKIQFIESESFKEILPLLQILYPEDGLAILQKRLDGMQGHGYQCVGIYDEGLLIGISGLWTLNKLYIGKHIEPDNIIIHPDYQGKGIGHQLMEWLETYAKEIDCQSVELNCYAYNEGARRFYESLGYEPVGIHYQKKLD